MSEDPVVNVMGAERTITRALGGTWDKDHGVVLCSALAPKLFPEGWSIAISDHESGLCRFTLLRDGSRSEPVMLTGDWGANLEIPNLDEIEEFKVKLTRLVKAVQEEEAHLRDELLREGQILRIWHRAQPIQGSPAEEYLRQKGLSSLLPDTLRYHPYCFHPSGRLQPAMVALVTDELDRVRPDYYPVEMQPPLMLHATYLSLDGFDEDAPDLAEFLLGHPGSAVELVKQPPEVKAPIVVAESIPSALALATLLPSPARIWATLSPEGMAKLRLPEEYYWDRHHGGYWHLQHPARLIVAQDGGAESREASQALASQAASHGWDVDLLTAPVGQTWTDVLANLRTRRWGRLQWKLEVISDRESEADPNASSEVSSKTGAELGPDLPDEIPF